jgi:predicted amidohydrolase
MRVSLVQFKPSYHDPDSNLARIVSVLENLDTDLAVLPELSLTGYVFDSPRQALELATDITGRSFQTLRSLSKRKHMSIVIGFAERDGDCVYNSAACLSPDTQIIVYRKAHLFDSEKLIFTPGNTTFEPIDVPGARIGMLVCYDHLYPEAARTLARKGVQIICHPSNLVLPGTAQLTTRVRSIENRVFWILADRVGDEGSLHFTGLSQITDVKGNVLTSADETSEQVLTVEIEPSHSDDKHITSRNEIFEDIRDELYGV